MYIGSLTMILHCPYIGNYLHVLHDINKHWFMGITIYNELKENILTDMSLPVIPEVFLDSEYKKFV